MALLGAQNSNPDSRTHFPSLLSKRMKRPRLQWQFCLSLMSEDTPVFSHSTAKDLYLSRGWECIQVGTLVWAAKVRQK